MAINNKIIQVPRRFVCQEWGGTETVIAETSRELSKLGYAVEIFTSLALSGIKREKIFGIPVRRFAYFYPRSGLSRAARQQLDMRGGNLLAPGLCLALLFSRRLKLIHLHTGGLTGGLVRLAARLRRVPYVLSIHGGSLDLPEPQLKELAAPLKNSLNWGKIFEIMLGCGALNRGAAAIICVGERERDLMARNCPQTRVEYIPNGVDIERFASGNAASFRRQYAPGADEILLYVGGFYPQKNHFPLLEAFAGIVRERPQIRLALIGVVYDRGYFDDLKRRLADLNIAEAVILLPDLKFTDAALIDAYAAASLFVFPSKYETFGIVALEAWAAGKPVICGKVGGLASFVRDNENGLFADVDSATDLRAKMELLLNDRALARRLAERGRADAGNYSWAKIAEKIAGLYEEIA